MFGMLTCRRWRTGWTSAMGREGDETSRLTNLARLVPLPSGSTGSAPGMRSCISCT